MEPAKKIITVDARGRSMEETSQLSDTKLSIRLSPEDQLRLEYIANSAGLSKAELIRDLIKKKHREMTGSSLPKSSNNEGQEYGLIMSNLCGDDPGQRRLEAFVKDVYELVLGGSGGGTWAQIEQKIERWKRIERDAKALVERMDNAEALHFQMQRGPLRESLKEP